MLYTSLVRQEKHEFDKKKKFAKNECNTTNMASLV